MWWLLLLTLPLALAAGGGGPPPLADGTYYSVCQPFTVATGVFAGETWYVRTVFDRNRGDLTLGLQYLDPSVPDPDPCGALAFTLMFLIPDYQTGPTTVDYTTIYRAMTPSATTSTSLVFDYAFECLSGCRPSLFVPYYYGAPTDYGGVYLSTCPDIVTDTDGITTWPLSGGCPQLGIADFADCPVITLFVQATAGPSDGETLLRISSSRAGYCNYRSVADRPYGVLSTVPYGPPAMIDLADGTYYSECQRFTLAGGTYTGTSMSIRTKLVISGNTPFLSLEISAVGTGVCGESWGNLLLFSYHDIVDFQVPNWHGVTGALAPGGDVSDVLVFRYDPGSIHNLAYNRACPRLSLVYDDHYEYTTPCPGVTVGGSGSSTYPADGGCPEYGIAGLVDCPTSYLKVQTYPGTELGEWRASISFTTPGSCNPSTIGADIMSQLSTLEAIAPTSAPTTAAPTTVAPTTLAPTTGAPTTTAPTTAAPTTPHPTTAAPTTAHPTTASPTTPHPTTPHTTTASPTTVPTSAAPTTAAPVLIHLRPTPSAGTSVGVWADVIVVSAALAIFNVLV